MNADLTGSGSTLLVLGVGANPDVLSVIKLRFKTLTGSDNFSEFSVIKFFILENRSRPTTAVGCLQPDLSGKGIIIYSIV